MENINVMELVLHEIDIVTKEQMMLVKYHNELEDRRLRLMEFVQNSEKLEISAEARDNLLHNVSDMELKLTKSSNFKGNNFGLKKKCRYDDRGYCKYLGKCKYQHFAHICDQYKMQGKCEGRQSCPFRHPKVCNFWKSDKQGCKRGRVCKYMHDNLKSIEVASSSNIKECEADKSSEESVDKATQKVVELEAELASNGKLIKDLKENEANLKVENKMNKEQVEKLMRVAINMHKELAELKTSNS